MEKKTRWRKNKGRTPKIKPMEVGCVFVRSHVFFLFRTLLEA